MNERNWRAVHRTVLLAAFCLLAAAAVGFAPSPVREIGRFVLIIATLGIVIATFTVWTWPRRYATVLATVIAVSWGAMGCDQMQNRDRNTFIAYAIQNLDAAQRQVELQTRSMASHEDVVLYLTYAHNNILALLEHGDIVDSAYAGFYSAIQRLKSERNPVAMKAGIEELRKNVQKLMNKKNRITWKGGGSTS